jgi:UDP-glucose 4-epimerase
MKILVTGGAGYIGSHTVKELVNNKHKVLIYDNLSSGHKEAVNAKAKLVVRDLADLDKLNKVFKSFKPEAVIHFAAFIEVPESVENPGKYYYNNVCFGINLLEAMAKYKVKNIIFSSSAAVYGNPEKVPVSEDSDKNPINPYGQTKLMFEEILKDYDVAYGIKSVALRYFNAAGASASGEIGQDPKHFTHVIPIIIKTALGEFKEFTIYGKDYPTPDGTCIRDYIHVEDLARAHRLALDYLKKQKKSNVFNLGKGKGNSNLELVNCVKKIAGINFKVKYGPRRPGDPARLIADAKKAAKELKWTPKYDRIESIIETAYNWHKNHPKGY